MVVFTLTLVRHGETVANRKNIIQGQKDWHLSPTGLDQVRLVAGRLQNEKFTHVFASDLNRAAETAKVIVENNKCCERIVIVHDKRLRERKFGVVEGKNYRELVSAAKKINASVANYTPTGAETLQQIQERAKSFFRDLCEQVRKSGRVEDGNYTPAPIKRRYEDAIDGCLHEQELHPASADTVDGITPNQNQTASSQLEEDSEHKRRRHAHNKTQKQQLDSNKELLLNKGVTNQGQILHECPASKIDKTCTTKNSESQACAAGEASVVSNEKLGAKAITGAGGDKKAVNEKCKAISGNVANNRGSNHFNSFTPCNSTVALTLSVDVPIHSVQPTSSAAPSSISKMGSSSTIAQSSKALNPINGAAINGVVSSGPSLSSQSNTQIENGATFNNGNVVNSTGDGNMKRSNSSSSSGFSSLQEENELLDSDDNSITALEEEEGNYNNNSNNNQQENDDNDDDDDEEDDDDDDDFCSKDSDSCYDSPFTVPVSDADVRGNIPCPKSTKYGCPNVSLSPLLEHRHSNFSSMSSGRSSSFDDGDSCHQNVADVLIVSHGGFLKELIRLFIDELECKFPGGKGHALRLSPNTGVSKFTITVGEPNKILVTCLLIHDKDHLLSAGLNSCLPINAVSVLPTGYLHVSKPSPLNISSTNGLPPTPSLSLPATLGSSYVHDPKPSLSGKSCPSLSSPVPSISSSSLLSSSKKSARGNAINTQM